MPKPKLKFPTWRNFPRGGICFERVVHGFSAVAPQVEERAEEISPLASLSAALRKVKVVKSPALTDESPVRDETVLSGN